MLWIFVYTSQMEHEKYEKSVFEFNCVKKTGKVNQHSDVIVFRYDSNQNWILNT